MAASSHSSTRQERLESLKAGALSAAIAASVTIGLQLLRFGLLRSGLLQFGLPENTPGQIGSSIPLPLTASPVHLAAALIFGAAFSAVSGALFGIIYRYIVRQDDDAQLASGAVGAFGLVRGLAQLESSWNCQNKWMLAIAVGESMVLFAIAQAGLQLALRRGWILPARGYGSASSEHERAETKSTG